MISASDVARYVSSPFALWCDKFAPDNERDDDSLALVTLKERGYAYEEELIEGETVSIPYETMEEGFRQTIEMMATGVPGDLPRTARFKAGWHDWKARPALESV